MKSPVKTILKSGIRCFCKALACFNRHPRPQHPERILLVAGGYLGDTFWALQTIHLLKEAYPEAEIHIAGRPFLHDLAHTLVPDSRIHEIAVVSDRTRESGSLRQLKREARILGGKIHPDLVFDMMNNRYSAWFCHHLKSYAVGMDIAEEASPLYSFCAKSHLIPSIHLAYRPRSIVNQFLGRGDSPDIELVPPVPRKSMEQVSAELNLDRPGRTVMLIPGAGWAAKRWDPARFRLLARSLSEQGFQPVISGAPDETDLCAAIAKDNPEARIICGSLSDAISLLPHCLAAVGNDSGVVHLSAAFGVRTITMFCQTNPAFCGPLGKRSMFLRAACPLSPGEDEHFCLGIPRLHCERPERMDCSVQQVMDLIRRP